MSRWAIVCMNEDHEVVTVEGDFFSRDEAQECLDDHSETFAGFAHVEIQAVGSGHADDYTGHRAP